MFSVIHFGSEAGGKNSIAPTAKKVIQVFCFVIPAMIHHLPAGLFISWITSNLFSLLQGKFFEIPAVKNILRIKTIDEKALKELTNKLRMIEFGKNKKNFKAISRKKKVPHV